MKTLGFLLLISLSCSCQSTIKNNSKSESKTENINSEYSYKWTKISDSADWRKNYNFQMFSQNDTIWTFHSDGNWFSIDNKIWTKSELPNVISNHAFLDYVQFKGAIYGLGFFKGNIEHFEFKPQIYKTTNFKNWEVISKASNLPKRFFYHPFVFDHKIWIIGGEDKSTMYSDIWSSEDAINWIKRKENLPFGKRSGSQIVTLNNTLYLLNNDVWSSQDGLNWQIVTDEIVKGELIFGYSAQVYDNKIWLLGCNRNGQFSSQVLYSSDGKNWKSQAAPWLPRGGIASIVHQGKIVMTGGKYGGTPNHPTFRYDNDIWTFSKDNIPRDKN